jgi:DNA-binding transcriptional regulator GbsR (MarR family)
LNNLQKRREIIEILGIHFESLYKISPLAGRILGLLIVDGCKSGLSFENIVEKLAASKSSISTNIKWKSILFHDYRRQKNTLSLLH